MAGALDLHPGRGLPRLLRHGRHGEVITIRIMFIVISPGCGADGQAAEADKPGQAVGSITLTGELSSVSTH